MPQIQLSNVRIDYEEAGAGQPVLMVHGYAMAGSLFGELGAKLAAANLRAIWPTWPLGAHRNPLTDSSQATPRGHAALIAEFIEALDLDDVVLLGSDTGGALCQIVAVEHPERIARLVLTNCDAFENFPPPPFRPLKTIARSTRALKAVLSLMKFGPIRRSPLGFGLLSHEPIDHLAAEWARAVREVDGVAEDVAVFSRSLDPAVLQEISGRLGEFEPPVLLPWGTDDKLFPIKWAHRLAEVLPNATVRPIENSRAFTMIDQCDTLAGMIIEFVGEQKHSSVAQ